MNIVGEIKGKHCIIVDDMIDTGLLSLFVLLCEKLKASELRADTGLTSPYAYVC